MNDRAIDTPPDCDVFEASLTLFHRHSTQNPETVRVLQEMGVLPAAHRPGFAILDIGAGQGCLPALLRPLADTLVLLEPNARCAEALRATFDPVVEARWDEAACKRLRAERPGGFDLVSMSQMLYHFAGLDDVRDKVALALGLVKPGGALAIAINQPDAPTARIGMAFQAAEGRRAEARTNEDIHARCHDPRFYLGLGDGRFDVAIRPVYAPLRGVRSRADLVKLLRMPLLDPLSRAPCLVERLDAHIEAWLDRHHPQLAWPATIPSRDDLVVLRRAPQ